MRLLVLLPAALLATLATAAAGQPPRAASPPAAAAPSNVVRAAPTDVALTGAVAEARRTFPRFAARLAAPQPRDERFSVKVAVPHAGGHEHLWLGDLVLGRDSLRGTVQNASVYVPGLTMGRRLAAPRVAVTDWMFVEAGVLRGAYTTRVLLRRMPADERRRLLAAMGVRLD